MKPKLSIIIPVYNVEAYLKQCLDSVSEQSYKCFECILVDDGSTDHSGEICDMYANNDDRFKVFHIENHGRSNARNLGIEQAMGEYITFIDSDDYICLNAYGSIMGKIENEELDICCYGMKRVTDNEDLSVVEFRNKNLSKNFINYDVYMHSVCNKVIRRTIVADGNLRFKTDLCVCEDMLFSFAALTISNKIGYISEPLYMYRVRMSSDRVASYSEIELRDFKTSYEYLKLYCEEKGISDKYKSFLKYRELYYAMLYLLRPEFYSPSNFRANRSRFNYWIYSFRPDYLLLSFCSALHFDLPANMFIKIKERRYRNNK